MKSTTSLLAFALIISLGACTHSPKTPPIPAKSNAAATESEEKLLLRSEDFKTLELTEIREFALSGTPTAPFTHALFGYIDPEDPDSNFRVDDTVPHKIGVYYGWALRLRPGLASTITVGESLNLPEPARVFKVNTDRSKVSSDGAKVHSELKLSSEDDWVFNFWQLTPGDPVGAYQIDLSFEGEPVVSFPFKVLR